MLLPVPRPSREAQDFLERRAGWNGVRIPFAMDKASVKPAWSQAVLTTSTCSLADFASGPPARECGPKPILCCFKALYFGPSLLPPLLLPQTKDKLALQATVNKFP